MIESFLNTAVLVGQSLRWYISGPSAQYRNSRLELYDQAAERLTKRLEFAEFLVAKLGEDSGETLEIAAGSGLVSSILQEHMECVTFLDLSLQALIMLKNRMQPREVTARIINADFLRLPFPDKHFDTVVCVGGYRYVA